MIETPTDVVDVRVDAIRVHADTGLHVVMLAEIDGHRSMPIWIGPAEANGIAMRLQGTETARPMSWDLAAGMLERFDLEVVRVVVTKHEEQVFYAAMHVRAGDHEEVLDARPSDALNLAVRTGAPVAIARDLFDRMAVTSGEAMGAHSRPQFLFWATLEDEADQRLGMVQLVGPVEAGTRLTLTRPDGGELTWEISPPATPDAAPPQGEAKLVR